MSSASNNHAVKILTSEVLRRHGFEKNHLAISLSGPEMIHDRLQKEQQLKPLLSPAARAYAEGDFEADYAEYSQLVKQIVKRNGNPQFGIPAEPNAITAEEEARYNELNTKIRKTLTADVIQAVLRDSGLFTAEDFAAKRVQVSEHGQVTLQDNLSLPEEQLAAARRYTYDRDPVRLPDGTWESFSTRQANALKAAAGKLSV